jgi:hypothetical protein
MGRERAIFRPREFRFVLPEIPTLYPVYVIRNKGGSTCVSPNSGFEAGPSASTWSNVMTQATVETVCDQLPDQERGVHPDPVHRAWTHMSLYRNYAPGPKAARLADPDRRRRVEPSTRWPGRPDGGTADRPIGTWAADGPGLPIQQLAPRARVAPASLSVEQLTDERYRRGTRPPDNQTMTHRRRRFDRPSSVSRPHRTLMAIDTPARPSDRIEPVSDHSPCVGESTG